MSPSLEKAAKTPRSMWPRGPHFPSRINSVHLLSCGPGNLPSGPGRSLPSCRGFLVCGSVVAASQKTGSLQYATGSPT
jgi:hypothetical protein